ncbi:MAG TPA: aldehyde dehydrogenase family protein [Acidimicrobiales bacterium]|nr:aldehyde dehydrogenase family protein [Acidimicrobiales bacterium]
MSGSVGQRGSQSATGIDLGSTRTRIAALDSGVADLVAARRPFIGGEWVAGHGPVLEVESPATGCVVATVEGASPDEFEEAIGAARDAFDNGPWPRLAPPERIAAVRSLGEALAARRDVLVETVIAEAGCPRTVTETAQVGMALASISELADLYERIPEWEYNEVPLREHLVGSAVRLSIRRYEPAGVVAAITPYNFPFVTNVWKVVPALLSGCSVLLRPSPLTPLSALVFGEAAEEAGIPPGVLNVVPEAGSEGAVTMTTHRGVDVVSFTGSTAVGRAVAGQAAATLKRLILELGGKSVALHLPDAVEAGIGGVVAAAAGVFAAHAGQGCSLQTRVLVPDDRRAEVIDAIAALAGTMRVGDPAEPTTLVGPLISATQRQRVDDLVQRAVTAGARCAAGGRAPAGLNRGWFYEPTVLDAPDPANPANQQEFFGPVVSVLGYRDLDDAVGIANASEYGLSGGIYTADLQLGMAIAERIRAGTVQVNTGWAAGYIPMGGYRQSGYGRERGVAGIRSFQELKHVVVGSR